MVDNLDTSESVTLFFDNDFVRCNNDDESDSWSATIVLVGHVATTWLAEGQTLTFSSAGAAVTTEVLLPGPLLALRQAF